MIYQEAAPRLGGERGRRIHGGGEGEGDVADHKRFSRWKRLPPVFRSGDHRLPGYENEFQRLTVYLPGGLLDLAEQLAELDDVPTIQEYCTRLLAHALENERDARKVADVEALRGPLEGLKEIAQDPQYLAEWKPQTDRSEDEPPFVPAVTVPLGCLRTSDERTSDEADEPPGPEPAGEPDGKPLTIRIETRRPFAEPVVSERMVPEVIDDRALDVVWRQVGPGDDDPHGFLPRLRRGEPPTPAKTAELLDALRRLEEENRGRQGLDRRLAYALHRLSLESQVLMTEAWPGAFDDGAVGAIRAVQEMVDRVLSGEDVRYYQRDEPETPSEAAS